MQRTFFRGLVIWVGCSALVFSLLPMARAQVMSSTNYSIQSDSINIGGGLSTSSNYQLESTVGEVATGRSSSTNFSLRAGYQQMQETYLSLTGLVAVTLSPNIPGVTGGTSNGSTTLTAVSDSAAGYSITIQASNAPAMQDGANTIADYAPSSGADFTFTTDASDAHFGFSPSGVDIVQKFQDDTTTCGTGSNDTLQACWDGLSTTAQTIVQNSSANHPTGATTTLYFRVGVGSSALPAPGTYTATTTVTLLPE